MSSCIHGFVRFGRQMLMPTLSQPINKIEAAIGCISLITVLALSILSHLPPLTIGLLTFAASFMLIGAITRIPLLVYAGRPLTPILLVMVSAIAIEVLF